MHPRWISGAGNWYSSASGSAEERVAVRGDPDVAAARGQRGAGDVAGGNLENRPLRAIRRNDLITLKTPAGVARFSVSGTKIVRPSDIQVLAAAPGRDLTLVTCYPFHYIGSAPERFIVHARQVS